jgi:hypothetical protein
MIWTRVQSSPSNNAANSTGDSFITPSMIGGQRRLSDRKRREEHSAKCRRRRNRAQSGTHGGFQNAFCGRECDETRADCTSRLRQQHGLPGRLQDIALTNIEIVSLDDETVTIQLLGTQHRALTRALTGAGDSVIGVVLRTTAITRC